MKSWCTLTSQKRIPDLINMHAHEIKRPNTAPSRRQSYPKLFHVTSPLGLTQCFWLLHPDPLLRFFSSLSGHKRSGCSVKFLPAFVSSVHLPALWGSPPLPSLPQLPGDCFMEELEGWPELARFCELGHEMFSDASSLLMVACLDRWVWRWTVHWILTWWLLLELVAFHSWQAFGCSVAL